MPLTRSVSLKGKRRADSIEGQPPQVSAPSGARPAKKRKLEETDALDAETLAVPSRIYATARTRRRSEELMRRRKRARLLQRASRVQIQVDKPKSPSPVALPTPNSVKEEHVGGNDPAAKDGAVNELTKLQAELAAKDRIIHSHVKSLQALQNLVQCQVCLEQMQKPYALVPCGHTSCLTCLQCWFRAPPRSVQEGDPVIPVSRRKKTCPQCRSIVTQRPVGVFLIRDFAHHVETMLSVHEGRPAAVTQEEANAGIDPWEGIFPAFVNRTADGAIVDHEDNGVRRCPQCTWEIFGGMCEGCGREFDDSDGEYDPDDEHFFMPPIDDYLFPPFPLAWYPGVDDYDDDEYDTPAEYDMDEYEGSWASDGSQEAGSRNSTPAFETYVDAQSERPHSPSQHSDYSGNSSQFRQQSVELVDGPSNIDLNTEAEGSINPSDSEDGRQVFLRAPHGNRHQVISSDDEDEHLGDGVYEDSQYGSD